MDDNKVKLELIYDTQTRHLTVNGPIVDRLLVYGLLEMAKDVIAGFHQQLANQAKDNEKV